jgi:KaiC/GvpD/RAD55 family RecA-like ATPase
MEENIISLLSPEGKRYRQIKGLLESLPEKYSVLFVETPDDRFITNSQLIKFLINKDFEIIYVAISTPTKIIMEKMEEEKLDLKKIKVIDAITMQSQVKEIEKNELDGIRYVKSPSDLLDLKIAIESALKKNKKQALIFDSVTTFAIYNKTKTTEKFLHTLTAKLKSMKVKMILIAASNTDKKLLATVSQFCDKAVSI